MSRHEAAIIYLDAMLGFRGAYDEFTEAAETLGEMDRSVIEDEISQRFAVVPGKKHGAFLLAFK